jgi:Zn-finger nucleic acid-binding protein
LICPESGRLLIRYKVGHGLHFHVDRSPVTGSVWLDKGEWEALKAAGLHSSLNLIFTYAYQREVRSEEHTQALEERFRQRIGAEDFRKLTEMKDWIENHPKRRDLCCYILDSLLPANRPAPTAAVFEARSLDPLASDQVE